MVKMKSSNTTLKDEDKFALISDIITHYDGGDKRIHQNEFFWYGNLFDKLMLYPDKRLTNLHAYILKKKTDGETKD